MRTDAGRAEKEEVGVWLTDPIHRYQTRIRYDPSGGTVIYFTTDVSPVEDFAGLIVGPPAKSVDAVIVESVWMDVAGELEDLSWSGGLVIPPAVAEPITLFGPGRHPVPSLPRPASADIHSSHPDQLRPDELEQVFAENAAAWRRDTGSLSSPIESAIH